MTAGLEALRDRDAAFEHWLREEVAPVYDAVQAHPDQLLSADEVFAEMRAHHARRTGESE